MSWLKWFWQFERIIRPNSTVDFADLLLKPGLAFDERKPMRVQLAMHLTNKIEQQLLRSRSAERSEAFVFRARDIELEDCWAPREVDAC